MADIGKFQTLVILRADRGGIVLDGGSSGEIPLSGKRPSGGKRPGDELEVFVFPSGDNSLKATLRKPLLELGGIGMLRCVSVTPHGAFLDWGLDDDILAPYGQQRQKMEEGRNYLVKLYLDEKTGRITASSRINDFLEKRGEHFAQGDAVRLIVSSITDLGFNAVIDGKYLGVLYKNEVYRPLKIGDAIDGFIKRIREDGKIDLALQKPGYGKVEDIAEDLLAKIIGNGGFLNLTDKSSPDEIQKRLGISKKSFKMAVGLLYKQKRIDLENGGLRAREN